MIPDKLGKLGALYEERILCLTSRPKDLIQCLKKRSIQLTNEGSKPIGVDGDLIEYVSYLVGKMDCGITFILTDLK